MYYTQQLKWYLKEGNISVLNTVTPHQAHTTILGWGN